MRGWLPWLVGLMAAAALGLALAGYVRVGELQERVLALERAGAR